MRSWQKGVQASEMTWRCYYLAIPFVSMHSLLALPSSSRELATLCECYWTSMALLKLKVASKWG